jgi:hypothetical protein
MPRLVLRVSPSVGAVDEGELRATLLEALERLGPVEQLHVGLLRRVGTLAISREMPLATRAGKILPFQLLRGSDGPPPSE